MSAGPIYGAPLGALPSHAPWTNVGDMLQEVLFELQRNWVRDYLFNSDPN